MSKRILLFKLLKVTLLLCPFLSSSQLFSQCTTISPSGPITYYNQYETTNQIILTACSSSNYQWYKNGVAIVGATQRTYTITFSGLTSYTDYYDVRTASGFTIESVEFKYIGCDDPTDYPSSYNPPSYVSLLNFPITLSHPPLGAGATYSWWTFNNPSPFSFSNQIGNTIKLNSTNCLSGCVEWIYSKAENNGICTYMFYGISAQ
ncbi:MAG: hypothetical protein ACTHOF_04050 [Flavisolibacter sp.]|jgi:hypothetical protein